MKTWKAILATLVIFSAGVFTGGLLVTRVVRPSQLPHPVVWRTEMLHRLTRALNLSPAQNEEIEAIVRESQERTRVMWDLLEPELRAEFRKAREDICDVLTPAQRKKFEDLLKQRQRRQGPASGEMGEPPAGPPLDDGSPPRGARRSPSSSKP